MRIESEDKCLLSLDEALRRKHIDPASFRVRYSQVNGFLPGLEIFYSALHKIKVHTDSRELDALSDADIDKIRRTIGPNAFEALQLGARINKLTV